MKKLFSPLKIKSLEFKNRIFVSPMCQYSTKDGIPDDWHLVHLGSRAVGGAGLVMVEATGVSPEGRISLGDTGLWNRTQMQAFQTITRFIKAQGSHVGIQLAHAGRKASTTPPWIGGKALSAKEGGWVPWGPSALAFSEASPIPMEMSKEHMQKVRSDFVASARLALEAGFEVIELHMAHGYLLNEFLSPLANQRKDEYGGPRENRMRFPLEVARTVREVWPDHLPFFVRISATDWVENGWDLEDSLVLCRELKKLGVDFIDCSTGGNAAKVKIPVAPGYQVPFAERIRKDCGILTGAVGLITEAAQAEEILANGQADAVLLAREFLRDPYWPLHAARQLDVDLPWPHQYERAK
jgi:2,4-dienoyl-CoA reductase-like NADH-dependent reductase (Old Yellow Enzyme family)